MPNTVEVPVLFVELEFDCHAEISSQDVRLLFHLVFLR